MGIKEFIAINQDQEKRETDKRVVIDERHKHHQEALSIGVSIMEQLEASGTPKAHDWIRGYRSEVMCTDFYEFTGYQVAIHKATAVGSNESTFRLLVKDDAASDDSTPLAYATLRDSKVRTEAITYTDTPQIVPGVYGEREADLAEREIADREVVAAFETVAAGLATAIPVATVAA